MNKQNEDEEIQKRVEQLLKEIRERDKQPPSLEEIRETKAFIKRLTEISAEDLLKRLY